MKLIKVANYDEMCEYASKMMIEQVRSNPKSTLGLATGSTPIGVYQRLIEDHRNNGTSYKTVSTINLDEYIGIQQDDKNSYHYFMKEQLFNHIDIPNNQTHVPLGMSVNHSNECERYEQLIQELGGIDLQLLGIGSNGHIGFNEPGTSFESRTHVVQLTASTREANARFFKSIDDVPTEAITVGIGTIMDSRQILLLASGESKAEAMKQLLSQEVTEDFPASILNRHKNATIIADQQALQLVK